MTFLCAITLPDNFFSLMKKAVLVKVLFQNSGSFVDASLAFCLLFSKCTFTEKDLCPCK